MRLLPPARPVLAAAAAILVLAGCGGSGSSGGEPATTDASPSAGSVAGGDATACGQAALGEWRAMLRAALAADPADRSAVRSAVGAAQEQSTYFAEQAESPGLVQAYREAAGALTTYAAALRPEPPGAAELARLRLEVGSVQGTVLVACAEALGG